jgi:hypothetical protein
MTPAPFAAEPPGASRSPDAFAHPAPARPPPQLGLTAEHVGEPPQEGAQGEGQLLRRLFNKGIVSCLLPMSLHPSNPSHNDPVSAASWKSVRHR